MLFKSFLQQLQKYQWNNKKIILAVSGGLDSLCLAQLFLEAKQYFKKGPKGLAGFDFVIAHCNFQLRAADSDADAALVSAWAEKNGIKYFQNTFDTNAIIKTSGDNVQIVARKLRYDWFEELRKELEFDFIATAHHLQDSVETLLMNFFKGTGILGLHGILPQQNNIIRPLLPFEKEALMEYAQKNNIQWREDVSNQKTDYLRNQVRLELLPKIESVFPKATKALYENSLRFAEVEILYRQAVEHHRKKLLEQRANEYYVAINKLKHCVPLATICLELFKPFGLHTAQLTDVLQLLESESGKYIQLPEWKIIKNRNFLILAKNEIRESGHILIEKEDKFKEHKDFTLKIKLVKSLPPSKQIGEGDLFVDMDLLNFPLVLRPWSSGDYFYPLGMNRKKKKVKKLLIDQKMPIHEKEKVWLIESSQKIIGICGIIADERFKVMPKTKEILHLHFERK